MWFVMRTGDCPPAVEYDLANLDAIGESNFGSAHAIPGVVDGATTVLVGMGDWTNTYVHPCQIFVYSYNMVTDSYGAIVRTLGDILPTATYSGSQPTSLRFDTDVSTYPTRYPGVGVEAHVCYDLSGASAKEYSWGSSFAALTLGARRGNVIVWAYASGASGVIKKYAVTGGATTGSSADPGFGWEYLHIHKNNTYIYGVDVSVTNVYQYDVSTLTQQTSFAVPTGMSAPIKLFSHTDNDNIWIAGTVGGARKFYERVSGAWTLKFTCTSFPVEADNYSIFMEGSTVWGFNMVNNMVEAWKVEPIGC